MFKGYQVMVTGASSGIGLEIAKEFLAGGAKVIGLGRDFSKIREPMGDNFIPLKCDLTDEKQIAEACKQIETLFDGRLDVLVSNAGAKAPAQLETLTVKEFDDAAHLLLLSGMLLTKHCTPYLRKSKNPSICHTSAIDAYMSAVGQPEGFLYSALKLALANYACQSAGILGSIRVNAICPGPTRTNLMPEAAWDALETPEALQRIPAGRLAEPKDTAKLVAFLSSEKAGFITGTVIKVDGSWFATHSKIAI